MSTSTVHRRYKARIDKIAPKLNRTQLQSLDSGMLGISLGARNSESTRLKASLDFLSENFKQSAMVVGDGVYYLTLQIEQGLSEEAAFEIAIAEGQALLERNQPIIQFYQQNFGLEVILMSRVREHAYFPGYLRLLHDYFDRSDAFAEEVALFAKYYLERVKRNTGGNDDFCNSRSKLAIRYLLEECAVFSVLQSLGWNCTVYGGSLSAFEKIASGEYPDILPPLRALSFVALKYERRGWIDTESLSLMS